MRAIKEPESLILTLCKISILHVNSSATLRTPLSYTLGIVLLFPRLLLPFAFPFDLILEASPLAFSGSTAITFFCTPTMPKLRRLDWNH